MFQPSAPTGPLASPHTLSPVYVDLPPFGKITFYLSLIVWIDSMYEQTFDRWTI